MSIPIDGFGPTRSLGHIFGGVAPEMRLSLEELPLVKERIREASRGQRRVLRWWWMAAAALALGEFALAAFLGGASVAPFIDDRLKFAGMGLIITGIAMAGLIMLVVHPVLTRRAMGEECQLYDAYFGTTENWRPRRLWALWVVLSVLLLALGTFGGALGTRVDENGRTRSRGRYGRTTPTRKSRGWTCTRVSWHRGSSGS